MIEKKIQFGIRNTGQNLWLPNNNPNEIVGWWRADVNSSLITTGDSVNTWNNLMDNTKWSMQSDGGSATPDVGGVVNGEPVLTFVQPQRLACSSQNTGKPKDGMMTVVTFSVIGAVDNGGDAIMSCEDNSNRFFSVNANDPTQFDGRFSQTGLGSNGMTYGLSGGPYSGNNIMATDLDFGTNSSRTRMNGTEVGSSSNYNTKLGNTNNFKMMANNVGNRQLAGSLGEMVVAIFPNGYTDSEEYIQKVEGYLAYKYGVQDLLPGLHPYKTQPPRE